MAKRENNPQRSVQHFGDEGDSRHSKDDMPKVLNLSQMPMMDDG